MDDRHNKTIMSAINDSGFSHAEDGAIGFESAGGATLSSRTELYVVMGILSFLSVMGTAGNALVLYVFSKKKDRLTSTLFILGLAFVDFTTCLIVIPYTIYIEYVDFHIKYDILCKIYQFLITSNIPFSALIMAAIAVDRYFCICHPFLHAMTLRRAKLMIACLGLFAAGLGVIVALMYGVYQKFPAPKQSQPNVSLSENVTSSIGMHGYSKGDTEYTVETARNIIFGDLKNNTQDLQVIELYTGHCAPNTFVLSSDFAWYYQKFYTGMYFVCLIIVIVLYILIYRSVLKRRTKIAKGKSKALPLVVTSPNDNNGNSQEETLLTTVNGEASEIRNGSSSTTKVAPTESAKSAKKKKSGDEDDEKNRRKSTRKDRNRIANLKTAAMLFVVTVVFIVTFLPAFLMALQLVPYSMTIFYMYFANNVANPVIYSFMNKNFRDDLKKMFCGR